MGMRRDASKIPGVSKSGSIKFYFEGLREELLSFFEGLKGDVYVTSPMPKTAPHTPYRHGFTLILTRIFALFWGKKDMGIATSSLYIPFYHPKEKGEH